MDIAIALFDRFTALDAVGPYETLSRLPGAKVTFVAAEPGPIATDNGMLRIVAERALDDLPNPDIVVVPGGIGTRTMMNDTQLVDWVRTATTASGRKPDYGCLWWLNTGQRQWPGTPASSFAAVGFGSNTVWIDPDHDLVVVWRWHDGNGAEFFKRIVDSLK